jgi:hypothetical protein
MGAPEGLPLNYRFSDAIGVFNSILRWRTLILVTPRIAGSCAVFPKTNFQLTSIEIVFSFYSAGNTF